MTLAAAELLPFKLYKKITISVYFSYYFISVLGENRYAAIADFVSERIKRLKEHVMLRN